MQTVVQRIRSSRRGGNAQEASNRRLPDPLDTISEQPLPLRFSNALPTLPLPHEAATTSAHAQADKLTNTFKATAVDTAVTAVAAGPTSRMQQWEGNNLVARVSTAVQNNGMQSWAKPGFAYTANRADDPMLGEGEGVQLGRLGGAKSSRKRSAETNTTQPAAKRWQIESFPGSVAGGVSKNNGLWETASAAMALEGGNSSSEAAQLGVEDEMAFAHQAC